MALDSVASFIILVTAQCNFKFKPRHIVPLFIPGHFLSHAFYPSNAKLLEVPHPLLIFLDLLNFAHSASTSMHTLAVFSLLPDSTRQVVCHLGQGLFSNSYSSATSSLLGRREWGAHWVQHRWDLKCHLPLQMIPLITQVYDLQVPTRVSLPGL